MTARHRLIAMYLPQFHPIRENDEWWGRGFTEWTNVAKAKPLFPGHYQPHLPSDLGFCDLRVADVRESQASLARAYGLDAFCYYHYWFNGHRLLERPFNEVLQSGQPDFPFCLCWANENWTRIWDGANREVLMAQDYSEDDDRRHIRSLLPAFADSRYLRIDGMPVFLVYRSSKLPDPRRTTDVWREEAHQAGLRGLFLVRVENPPADAGDPSAAGFDAAMAFQPAWAHLPWPRHRSRAGALASKLGLLPSAYQEHRIYDYQDMVDRMLQLPKVDYLQFPSVTPSWDNSARRKQDAVVVHGSTPEKYERWLKTTLERFVPPTPERNLVFVNAWNEWAEGNHLEPDQRWGRAYLEATKRAVDAVR